MVSPYHQIENARTVMDNVARHSETTDVKTEEELGWATIEFRFAHDATLLTARNLHEKLIMEGWEEVDSESGLRETVRYEWDKSVLTED